MLTIILILGALVGGFFIGKNASKAKIEAVKTEILNLESKAKGLAQVAAVDVMAAITFIKGKVS